MRVFVTGATGLVGARLVRRLLARGDSVVVLSRRPVPPDRFASAATTVVGDPSARGPWVEQLRGCDAVVHLAGENIFAKRWTAAVRAELRASRVNSTAIIALELAKHPTKVFVSASAVGYYGPRGGEEIAEDAAPGGDFLAKLCADWEAAAAPARLAGIRVVHPRLGVVLDPDGGALPQMARPFRLFVGGRIGSGRQFVSWIHRDDLTDILLFLIDTPAAVGPVNATAPQPVTNAEFSRELAKALGRPNWLPVPGFALRAAVGGAAEAALTGQRVVPAKALAMGFRFRFPAIAETLADLFASKGRG